MGGVDTERRIAGRYLLAEVIGSGGMGVVWRATDTELDRPVALKRARKPGNPNELKLMRRKARHTGSLRHEHIVTLHDIVIDDSGLWLVMERSLTCHAVDLLMRTCSCVGGLARLTT